MPGAAWAQRRDTLKISLALAEERAMNLSPLLAESHNTLRLAQARATQARNSRILPTATLRNVFGVMPRARGEFTEFGVLVSPDTNSGFSDLRPFTDLEINLVQPLFTFGRLSSAVAAAESGVRAAEAGVEAGRDGDEG